MVILNRHRYRFGITATCLVWFELYLANRSQRFQTHGRISAESPVVFGVPQVPFSAVSCLFALLLHSVISHVDTGRNVGLYANDT